MNDHDALERIADKIDQAVIRSRLNSLAVMTMTDRADRLSRLRTVLQQLRAGAYLIGTGPSTTGIIPLSVDEVVLGRAATPLEQPSDTVVDYQVADTLHLTPHEVSRVHAKIVRKCQHGSHEFRILDLDSTCGTFLNGTEIKLKEAGHLLETGDMISLGPSHTSTYIFLVRDV